MESRIAHRIIEAHIIVMQLDGEHLGVQIVHDQVEDLIVLGIFGVPDGLGALLPVPHCKIDIRVHFTEQIAARGDMLHLYNLQNANSRRLMGRQSPKEPREFLLI